MWTYIFKKFLSQVPMYVNDAQKGLSAKTSLYQNFFVSKYFYRNFVTNISGWFFLAYYILVTAHWKGK